MEGEYFETYTRGLLELCGSRNVQILYLAVDFPIPAPRVGVTAELLKRAHAKGVRVEASAYSQRGDDTAGVFLDGLLEWNRTRPTGERFDGAHFDHEDYNRAWLETLRSLWEGKTLAELRKIDPKFTLGVVAIPALWWGTEERRRDYAYPLQDFSNYVAVMSYFQADRTLSFFTGPSQPAIDYASRTGKKIHIGLEVSTWPGEGAYFPGWEHMSFFPVGEAELAHRFEKINAAFTDNPGFGNVVIESSDAYQRMRLITEEIARDRQLHGETDATAEALPPDARPVELAGLTSKTHHSAEDPGMKTRMATVDITPALTPGDVLVFDLQFAEHLKVRPNPLTENTVSAELIWFGFIDPEPAHRFLRVDFNGGLGMRTVTNRTLGPPGTWKDLIRFSHDRFRPRPGEVYEGRLYFFSDSKVLLKIIDSQTRKVAWHSDRMPLDRRQLGRMYLEIVEEAGASASVTYHASTRTLQFLQGDNPAGSISHLRHARLPRPAMD